MFEGLRSGFAAYYTWSPTLAIASFAVVWLLLGLPVFFWLKSQVGSPTAAEQPSTVNSPGATSYQAGRDLTVVHSAPPLAVPSSQPAQLSENLLRNGGFEQGLDYWGTGWLEDQVPNRPIASRQRYLVFAGAKARWAASPAASRSGSTALRVEHETPYAPEAYSTLSQTIPVKRATSYECVFWVKADLIQGDFNLRITPSRYDREAWDRFKKTIDPNIYDWREYRMHFHSGDEERVDVRFVAEGLVKAWIDDVVVREAQPVLPAEATKLKEQLTIEIKRKPPP